MENTDWDIVDIAAVRMKKRFADVAKHKGDSDTLNSYCISEPTTYPYPLSIPKIMAMKTIPDLNDAYEIVNKRSLDVQYFDSLPTAKEQLKTTLVDIQNWCSIMIERLDRGLQ